MIFASSKYRFCTRNTEKTIIPQIVVPDASKWLNRTHCDFPCFLHPVLLLSLSLSLSTTPSPAGSSPCWGGLHRPALINVGPPIEIQNSNKNSQQEKQWLPRPVVLSCHALGLSCSSDWHFLLNTIFLGLNCSGVTRVQVELVGRIISVHSEVVQYEHEHQFGRLFFQMGLTTTKSSKNILT